MHEAQIDIKSIKNIKNQKKWGGVLFLNWGVFTLRR